MKGLSVIVAVFNTSQYLPQCLDSILNQGIEDLEIICIDDCSTDTSLSVLHSYRLMYPHTVNVLKNDKNKGYGYSMNKGIKAVTKALTYFVDSDDFLEPGTLKAAYNLLAQSNEDMLHMLSFNYVQQYGSIELCDVKTFNPLSIRTDNIITVPDRPWLKMYKTEFLKKFKFTESPGASYQDISFGAYTCGNAKGIVMYQGVVYNYRVQRMGSSNDITFVTQKGIYIKYELIKFLNVIQNSLYGDVESGVYAVLGFLRYFCIRFLSSGDPICPYLKDALNVIIQEYRGYIKNPDQIKLLIYLSALFR